MAPDRPGMGKSPFVGDRCLLDWPESVLDLADNLGWNKFSVMGVSGGGPYALSCAAKIPDRLDRVIVCSGVPHPDWLRQGMSAPKLLRKTLALFDKQPGLALITLRLARTAFRITPLFVMSKLALPLIPLPERTAVASANIRRILVGSVKEAFRAPALGLLQDIGLITADWGFTISQLKTGVQFWHGDQDNICPLSELEPLVNNLAHAKLTIVRGQGHFSLPITHATEVLRGVL